jgi:hypothetical protein
MAMSEASRVYLSKCNCMGKWAHMRDRMPLQKVGEAFFTPSGLKALPPDEWQLVAHDEIVREMDESGVIPIGF